VRPKDQFPLAGKYPKERSRGLAPNLSPHLNIRTNKVLEPAG